MSADLDHWAAPTPEGEETLDLLAGALGSVQIHRPFEQITRRGRVLRRRRAATVALGTTAAAVLTSTLALLSFHAPEMAAAAPPGTPKTPRATATTDPDWKVTQGPSGSYTIRIAALGDTDRLNATLAGLGIEIVVTEQAPGVGQRQCSSINETTPSDTATALASSSPVSSPTSTASMATATFTSDAATTEGASATPTPTATAAVFTGPGTPATFLFARLPSGSQISFLKEAKQTRYCF